VTHTTKTFDTIGETTQTVVRTSQESARIFTDYTVKAQELNTQFARRAVETWIDGLRKQTELSQAVAQELFGRAEEQADAYRRF
jgi:tellurite resistance protein